MIRDHDENNRCVYIILLQQLSSIERFPVNIVAAELPDEIGDKS